MMNGSVNAGAALLELTIIGANGLKHDVEATLDTGFSGYLTLPGALLAKLGFSFHSHAIVMLADGSTVGLRRFEGIVTWHEQPREVMILEAEGGPLIGMSLLQGSRVTLEVADAGALLIEPLLNTA